jgi:hypothetical protein
MQYGAANLRGVCYRSGQPSEGVPGICLFEDLELSKSTRTCAMSFRSPHYDWEDFIDWHWYGFWSDYPDAAVTERDARGVAVTG